MDLEVLGYSNARFAPWNGSVRFEDRPEVLSVTGKQTVRGTLDVDAEATSMSVLEDAVFLRCTGVMAGSTLKKAAGASTGKSMHSTAWSFRVGQKLTSCSYLIITVVLTPLDRSSSIW